ncbi:MAG: glycosyltransferase family 1 protein [Calditrichaeota bacterium]|nr:MAG: glycosyltransferase family 1 protein [Calditrichota bacterium]MBL1206342.1 glycosyltransferase family 1 protein [Calditrichota bacterium]NOG46168.1 glycosyltransferase [Calditrichota bacterium]
MAKEPTKILHITSYPPPRAGWGMRVYFLKQEMEKNGDVCEVLNIGKGRFITDADFVPVLGSLDYIKKVFRFRLKGFLIHHHLNGDSPKGFVLTFLSLTISLLTFRRPVITFHAGPVQLYFPKYKAPKLTLVYKYIFSVSKYIVCNNEAVKNNIMTYGVNGKKIVPIQAFSTQYMQFEEQPLTPELDEIFSNHFPAIVCYAAYRPEFFLEDMVTAFAKFHKEKPDSRLIMMGQTLGSEKIKEQMEELGFLDAVHFAGDMDHDQFLTLLSKSTFYLRTPFKDGVSSSVLESLSLNTPVVACENGSRPEGVIKYENQNIDDMVKVMLHTVDNIDDIKKNLKAPPIPDTISTEIELIKKA